MTSIQDAVDQSPAGALGQLVERYASVLLGPTRQLGPASAQDDLTDLLPSSDALGVVTETADGNVVIVMMTPSFVTEIAGAPDAAAAASAIQPVFDRVAAELGTTPSPVRAIVGPAQLSECIGDRPVVISAGVFAGETIDATVSVASFSADGAPRAGASSDPAPAPQAATTMPVTAPAGSGAAAAAGAQTQPLDSSVLQRGLQLLADVHLDVTAQLGQAELTVSQLLDLTPGAVIELDRLAGAPLDLFVNGSLFARADVIVVEDTYAVQITEIVGDGTAV